MSGTRPLPQALRLMANQIQDLSELLGVADSRYESTFPLKLQNSPSSGLIAIGKS